MTSANSAVTWDVFAAAAPGLAKTAKERFESAETHVLATLRKDGGPRVSGTEVSFRAPDITIGSMPGARKARDLQRSPAFAIHANPADPDDIRAGGADIKISGTAVEVADPDEVERYRDPGTPPGPFHLFRLLLSEVVATGVEGDRLVVRLWRPGGEVREFRRS
ncbi:pyridoxamine 5'-phosphate oxidase [Murinocardiopsis flavida]|uniref:Pyridoxamine 5'-phosphate oxidase n=1 Tax=Murinocardiopsis flavida TaxID=645275 RepID=A0A2P8D2B5_9ACTN|nr:pyridoxamine 5'-phosphate oxidase family protein [Murinocardiopsis flavida]PSK91370.1 pyridoxamine 5'-phosphate oxidase [Murinocardiopsis flavida]